MDLIDKHELFQPYKAPCLNCKHKFDSETYTCLAFPKGIPDVILKGENMHAAPMAGQENDLIYAPKG